MVTAAVMALVVPHLKAAHEHPGHSVLLCRFLHQVEVKQMEDNARSPLFFFFFFSLFFPCGFLFWVHSTVNHLLLLVSILLDPFL